MSTFGLYKLWLKVLAAKYLRITSPLSDQELDALLQTCSGDPELRGVMVSILRLRR
jgi:hypothetical protein